MVMTRKARRLVAAEAQALKHRGEAVAAIKHLRTKTGCGLHDAYVAVNKLGALPRITVQR